MLLSTTVTVMDKNKLFEFVIYGVTYKISVAQLEAKVIGNEPSRLHKYSVRIGRRDYPIKQAVGLALGIPASGFTADTAYRILQKLGYTIQVRETA